MTIWQNPESEKQGEKELDNKVSDEEISNLEYPDEEDIDEDQDED